MINNLNILVNCKYNKNENYFKNDKLIETVSVCTKKVKPRITQTTSYESPGTLLVFCCLRSWPNYNED